MARKHLANAVRRIRFAAVSSVICVLGAQQVAARHGPGDPPESALVAPAAASARARERCAEAAVDVAAASSDRRLVCAAAGRALERLGRCGIVPQGPVRIQILDQVRHPRHGELIFGFFDTARDVVLATRYDNIPDLVSDTPYSELRPLAFYQSLIVHEVVHGVMHQNMARAPTSSASYEYPAYALQLESLPYHEREKLLRAGPRDDADHFMFNDMILFFDPFFFAAQAYQHFEASPNTCARLRALLDGEVPFISLSPLP